MTDRLLEGKTFLIFAGEAYEELELWYPKYRLQEAGAEVHMAGYDPATACHGKYGYPCKVDLTLDQISGNSAKYDGVICPGGWMPDKLRREPIVLKFIQEMHAQEKLVAAICHGGWMPISAGVYNGVQVTGSPGIRDDLVNAGAIWEDAPVVVDRHFVSSRRPDDLPDFMIGILSLYR